MGFACADRKAAQRTAGPRSVKTCARWWQRLQFLRTLPPDGASQFLLPRTWGRNVLCTDLRTALHTAAAQAGIPAHIVPHQLRHTYATTMLRAGVSLPALMKLLGHRTANMTLRYVEITQKDLQREFHLARSHPRHLLPLPAPLVDSDPPGLRSDVGERLSATIRALDLYRQQNPSRRLKDFKAAPSPIGSGTFRLPKKSSLDQKTKNRPGLARFVARPG